MQKHAYGDLILKNFLEDSMVLLLRMPMEVLRLKTKTAL